MRRVPFAAVVVFSLLSFFTPGPDLPEVTEDVWDKAGHAGIFALLAITGVLAAVRGLSAIRLAAGLFGYAVVTEILQAVLPIHRSGDWHDVIADSVGIVVGLIVGAGLGAAFRGAAPAHGGGGPRAGRAGRP